MQISKRDQLYGAVLRKLARHGTLHTVREVGDKAGHFRLNDGTYLLMKYSTNAGSPWRFTFRPEDIETLLADYKRAGLFGGSFICLICGIDVICPLAADEWSKVLDLNNPTVQQTICVSRVSGCQLEVTGTGGGLDRKIPAARFPAVIFTEERTTRVA